jgi:hypothetical protein
MSTESALFVSWDRPIPGQESKAIELYRSTVAYCAKQAAAGLITSFEPMLLSAHGGEINGFVVIRGRREKLDTFLNSDGFQDLIVKGMLILHGLSVVPGYVGEELEKLLTRVQNQL